MFNFPENIVTRTAIGRECLTAFHSNCGGIPYENLGLNSFQLRKKRTARILVTTSTLFNTLNNCCCREFVCLTENWWSSLVLAMVIIGNGHWRNMDDVWWSNIILEFLIEHCSWVPDQILFQTRWCQTLSQDADARYLAYHYYTALFRKALLAIVYCTEQ